MMTQRDGVLQSVAIGDGGPDRILYGCDIFSAMGAGAGFGWSGRD